MMTDYENLFNTVKLNVIQNDEKLCTATSFFYKFNTAIGARLVLITNRHVIENIREITFFIHQSFEAPGKIRKITLGGSDIRKIIKIHNECDLCAIDINDYLNDDRYYSLSKFDIVDESELKYEKVMQEIFIVGYPIGIEDELNKLPIFTTGITATNLLIDYNGKPEFLLNAFALPGSSGSPVFTQINNTKKLVGIISSGTVYSDGKPISNLCLAIKAKEILELEKYF